MLKVGDFWTCCERSSGSDPTDHYKGLCANLIFNTVLFKKMLWLCCCDNLYAAAAFSVAKRKGQKYMTIRKTCLNDDAAFQDIVFLEKFHRPFCCLFTSWNNGRLPHWLIITQPSWNTKDGSTGD